MRLEVKRRYRPEKNGLSAEECEALNLCDAIVLQHTGRHLDGTEDPPKPQRRKESLDRKKIARRLREARAGRYESDVCEACGIVRSALCQYETGKRIPRDAIKVRLAQYYGKTVQELFYEE